MWEKTAERLGDFLESARDYLDGRVASAPRLEVHSADNVEGIERLVVYFDDPLLREICRRPSEYKKCFNSLLTYGYVGGSRGGRNGIVKVNGRRDHNVAARMASFLGSSQSDRIFDRYGIDRARAEPVKIVAHQVNGERVVGVMDRAAQTVIFFNKVNYKK